MEWVVALLDAPKFDGANSSAWEAVEREFGIGYPEDFRAFVDLYGPGRLNAVRFMHPTAGRIRLTDTVLSDIDFLGPLFDEGAFPAPLGWLEGQLLPFAHDTSGTELLFQVAAESANQWHVCAYVSREFIDFGCGFDAWLHRYITGDDEIDPWVAQCGKRSPTFTSEA